MATSVSALAPDFAEVVVFCLVCGCLKVLVWEVASIFIFESFHNNF